MEALSCVLQRRLLVGILFFCVVLTMALVEHPIVDTAPRSCSEMQLPQLTCAQLPSTAAPFAVTSTGYLCARDSPEVQLTVQHKPADDGASGQPLNLSLPLPMTQLLRLRAAARPSQLGIGHFDQLNQSLRSSVDIPADQIQLSESSHQALHRMKDDIVEQFIRHTVTADTKRDLSPRLLRL